MSFPSSLRGSTGVHRDPAVILLLSIVTCGRHAIYGNYKTAKKTVRMKGMAGIPPVDNRLLYLILNVVLVGFVNVLLQQPHLNEIWRRS